MYQTTRNKSGSQRPIGGSSVLVGIQPMASQKMGFAKGKRPILLHHPVGKW